MSDCSLFFFDAKLVILQCIMVGSELSPFVSEAVKCGQLLFSKLDLYTVNIVVICYL